VPRLAADSTAPPFGDPPELKIQIVRGLPAVVWIFLHTSLGDVVERGRYGRLRFRERVEIERGDGGDEHRPVLAFERFRPSHHLVEDGAEGEDVGPRVSFVALQLLRRHVLQRAHRDVRRQDVRARRSHRHGRGLRWCLRLRHAEVHQLHADVLVFAALAAVARCVGRLTSQKNVRGLQVAMHDAQLVCLVQRIGEVDGDLHGRVQRQRTALEALGERFAFQVLRDQEPNRLRVEGRGLRACGRWLVADDRSLTSCSAQMFG